MKLKSIVFLITLLSSVFSYVFSEESSFKPNIIIFYADDLGWQDTPLNDIGSPCPWETPNIMALAKEGINFRQAYSPAPTCAPSRTAMMTGKHPAHNGMTHVAGGRLPVLAKKGKIANQSCKLIHPFFTGRMREREITIAEALKKNGYVSGHVGKWHMAANHHSFPEAVDQGFDFQYTDRGVHSGMKGSRLKGFATYDKNDPYKLDVDGRPYDGVTENALTFLQQHKDSPFFLYMATWLVHVPIQTRDSVLLDYYCKKIGVPFPKSPKEITTKGQTNPYYGAMVNTLDWSLGKIVDYLKRTPDPRNAGKKLFETTYLFFSSDNGGAERHAKENITDNFPLRNGKKYLQEGGVRVPMIVTGPHIPKGKIYDGMISQLDFYPTIMSLTHTSLDDAHRKELDGEDISKVIKGVSDKVMCDDGKERAYLFWHFPHNTDVQMQSSIRDRSFKLYYNHFKKNYELYQLYLEDGKTIKDIEENKNVYAKFPKKAKELKDELQVLLRSSHAKFPHYNPKYSGKAKIKGQENVPKVISKQVLKNNIFQVRLSPGTQSSKVVKANLLYTLGEIDGEWFEGNAIVEANGKTVTATIPPKATYILMGMVDENNFFVMTEETSCKK